MFGDILKSKIRNLSTTTASKGGKNPFWKALKEIAVEEIKAYAPNKVDSGNATKIYHKILEENEQYIPEELREELPSNHQKRYRVINRNMWSSNAFHPDGLANAPGIIAHRKMNNSRRGDRVIYRAESVVFGDVLRGSLQNLTNTSPNKSETNSFWKTLRDIAAEEIKSYSGKIESANAIDTYFRILEANENLLPKKLLEELPSNHQKKYRVQNRNMWSSNAFHHDGLANMPGVVATRKASNKNHGNSITYRRGGAAVC